MRLTLRGLLVTFLLGALALLAGCAADSPTPTSNGGGGGNNGNSSALAIQLTTTNASPKAGACTIVQAFATLSGAAVPDGTSIVFSTSFGFFAQNGLQTISLVSQSGAAAAAVCSDSEGTVTVKGTVTLAGKTAQRSLILQFTTNGLPPPGEPFISVCANPHSGPVTGGTVVTISGGGFGTSIGNVRVFFRSGAVIHQGVVTGVTDSTITVITPAFPELNGLGATSVDVQVVLGAGFILDSPNCFTFTASSAFVSICANPGSGPLTGGTAVTIQGGGFGTDLAAVQVFFRIGSTTLPGVVTGVTDSSISVITPAFTGLDPTKANVADVIVKIGASTTVTSLNCFTFTSVSIPPVVSSILPTSGTKLGGTRATILGSGFSSPVQVFFGTVQAEVVSVNFSQIVVITPPVQSGAAPGAVQVTVRNGACSGTCVSNGVTYTYTVPLSIISFSPLSGNSNTVVTIFGQGFVAPVQVLFGNQEGTVVSVSGTQILAKPPAGCSDIGGQITVILIATGEAATSSASFTGPPAITGSIAPSTGPVGVVTPVVLTGTGLFPAGNFAALQLKAPATGGTVTLLAGADNNGAQTVNLSITPNPGACVTTEFVTFTLVNTVTGCSLDFTFTGTGTGMTVSSPSPSSGPSGVTTHGVTVSGTGLFPTGQGNQLVVNSQSGGTVVITGTTDGTTQSATLDITPNAASGCTASVVTFTLKNNSTGCVSQTLTFTGTSSGVTVTSGPTPSSGPSGSSVTVTGANFFRPGFPSDATIVNQAGGTVTITNRILNGDGTETLVLAINATNPSAGGLVTFQIENTSITGTCKDSSTLQFTATAAVCATTANTPNPSTIPSGGTTTGITVSGTGFFTTGTASCTLNPSNVAIINVTPGFTVTVTCETESGGVQTLTLTVVSSVGCSNGSMSFQIENTATACTSNAVTINTTGGITVNGGPNPSGGPAGASTIVTISGTGFFPSGIPVDAQVCDPTGATCGGSPTLVTVSGGTVAILNATESAGVETLQLSITPNVCSPDVIFKIKNSFTGCLSTQQFFNNTSFVKLAASFTQAPGAPGSMEITFTNTTTGGVPPYTCLWTAGGNNAGFPTIAPAAATCSPVTVTWDCDAITPCTSSPFIELKVTDHCTVVSDTGPVLVTPP